MPSLQAKFDEYFDIFSVAQLGNSKSSMMLHDHHHIMLGLTISEENLLEKPRFKL